MLVFALLLSVVWAQTPSNPTCCSHSYWTGRCTACPGYWYQTCNSGYRDADQKGCGFLGCTTKCYNSCRYKNYGCGCNNSTSCHKKDCVVSGWSSWGSCTKACGTGTQTRTRRITTNAAYGGTACPNNLSETRNCNTQCCKVDCAVSGFGAWGACSAECGGGTQRRTRTVTRNASCNGVACPALFEERACNTQCCAQDCVVGAYSEWGACSAECGGGTQKRSRSVTTAAACGGTACPALEDEQDCNLMCCAVDCVVGTFGEWGACSAECDGGKQTRTRSVTTAAACGGATCPALEEEQDCNTEACCPKQLISAQKFATNTKASNKKKLKGANVDALACACETRCAAEDTAYTYWFINKIKKGKQAVCNCLEGELTKKQMNKEGQIKGAAGGLTEAARTTANTFKKARRRRRDRRRRRRRN